ncbi:hypothetical protein Pint_18375 [Pistacia integerrima]|uniref:Uncharacterized protein n=1 Tax=Pistacia integerrima TaxID=434235 RepID=A0ACC0YWE1_9ROSI|nr:hypothetical protein Pint_18375 [Pistacia integerrima]
MATIPDLTEIEGEFVESGNRYGLDNNVNQVLDGKFGLVSKIAENMTQGKLAELVKSGGEVSGQPGNAAHENWGKMMGLVRVRQVGLRFVANGIDKPLQMDKNIEDTCRLGHSRIGFVRVLVEVNANRKLPERMEIRMPSDGSGISKIMEIRVEYQWRPS